jgi:hypothetical protein
MTLAAAHVPTRETAPGDVTVRSAFPGRRRSFRQFKHRSEIARKEPVPPPTLNAFCRVACAQQILAGAEVGGHTHPTDPTALKWLGFVTRRVSEGGSSRGAR